MSSEPLTADFTRALRQFAGLPPQPQGEVIQRVGAMSFPTPANFILVVRDVAASGWYKRCATCRQGKAENEFYRDRSKPDGRMYDCQVCYHEKQERRVARQG